MLPDQKIPAIVEVSYFLAIVRQTMGNHCDYPPLFSLKYLLGNTNFQNQ